MNNHLVLRRQRKCDDAPANRERVGSRPRYGERGVTHPNHWVKWFPPHGVAARRPREER